MTIRLSFGTAGIRAPLGPGDDQMNAHAVEGVVHALCAHLAERDAGARGRGVCVGFDGRTQSDEFARTAVRVARAHGFRVRAFEAPVPTPLLAFVTRHFGAAAGVMVTASHNPPGDNGVKIYLEGGAQVTAPHDRAIAARLATYRGDELPSESGPYEALGAREVDAYLAAVQRLVASQSSLPLPRIAYSALSGVGSAVTRELLARAGVHDVVEVAAQAEPRPDLGGLASPNPEHPSALAALLAEAESSGAALAFAHDPDADRLAVIVRDDRAQLRVLSGDEVGALLGSFVLGECADRGSALLVSTLVSGELLERIAVAEGARFVRTPTGFKWMASRARTLERSEGLSFVFGYEEAIGYAFGTMADDKDGIAALYVLLEQARRLAARGATLWGELQALYARHGLFATRQITVPRGAGGSDVMDTLRTVDPVQLLGTETRRTDHALGPDAVDLVELSTSHARLCARPSGTEPKLKLYLHARADVTDSVEAAREQATRTLDALEARVRTVV